MQRNVPQFIEIEDKIFGPFTMKQFAYLIGGFGLSVVIWRSMPLSIGIFLIGPVMGFSIALAYAKFNSKPFIDIVRSAIGYFFSKKMYSWQSPTAGENITRRNAIDKQNTDTAAQVAKDTMVTKTFNKSDIKDLAARLNNNTYGQ